MWRPSVPSDSVPRRRMLRGMIQAEMRLGEGTGAVAALPLLDLALAVYQSGHTFAQLGIEAYTPQ